MKFITGLEADAARDARSVDFGFATVGDSLTVQADARDADINVIMERYAKTGQFPGLSRIPSYGDFDGISDYREAIHAVREAEDLFMQLPAKVRNEFGGDPAVFVEFCENPENRVELARRGLLRKEVADAVLKEADEGSRVAESDREEGVLPDGAEPGRGGAGAAGAPGRRRSVAPGAGGS